MKAAITHLHGHVEHILTRINRIFPRNSPEEGLREVTRLLSWLVIVDEDDTFGEHNGKTVGQYLKRYAKVGVSRYILYSVYQPIVWLG